MRINFKQAADFLRENDEYLILTHASPDGDTLGCGWALCGALQRIGKKAKTVCPEEIPARFGYLFKAAEPQEFEYKKIVCVDVADIKLLGEMRELGAKADLCVDHHVSHKDYAKLSCVEPSSAAACEIIYEIIKELGVPFDKALANCIYTGVSTDTGCFKFSNTTPRTHEIAAEMIEYGADFTSINYTMFMMKTRGRITLEQEAMKTLKYFADGKVAVLTVPLAMLKEIPDIDNDDIGALANMPQEIAGVDVGICVKEKKSGYYKASLRSSERVDAAEICRHFGGGGHARAAGCSFHGMTMDDAVKNIVDACVKAVEKL